MNLYIAMEPTLCRWFSPTQLNDAMHRMAFTDLLQYVAETAVGESSELDVIGPSLYLVGIGIPRAHVDHFVAVCGEEIRQFYHHNTLPEWRAWGRHRIQIDARYGIFIQLGIDPYA